jgi:citrate lyase beta subunit
MKTSLSSADLEPLLSALTESNERFMQRFPGQSDERQPVHTVYGGAQLYSASTVQKLGRLALANLNQYAPNFVMLAKALGFAGAKTLPSSTAEIQAFTSALEQDSEAIRASHPKAWLAFTVYQRVAAKLASEPVEDNRVDFEDGYGNRPNAEEDLHAEQTASAMAEAMEQDALPNSIGIRVKAFTEEARSRAIRTLDLFLTALAAKTGGRLPSNFVVTLPKVCTVEQVSTLARLLTMLEKKCGFQAGSIKLELMIETTQAIFTQDGRSALPDLVQAAEGRCTSVAFGTMDYTASCNIASTHQSHNHPAADFARHMIQVSLAGTGVNISDGITNVMPIAPHRATDENPLDQQQIAENMRVVHAAWKLHFDNISSSLRQGYYQGWDLNPAQIPIRFAAVYYFFLTGLQDAGARLKTFIDQAAQASMVGNVFDDAATGQGLLNFFLTGIGCGAITEDEALATGITMEELHSRSFLKIVENRTSRQSSIE